MSRFFLSVVCLAISAIIHYPGEALPPQGESFADLPWTAREIEFLSSLPDADVYTGADATEDAFKEMAHRYRIVHLATHAVVDDSMPAYSKLILNRRHGSREDGLLHAYEIYGLDLRADLVVLGACRSGTGKFVRGEGVVGMTHAFLHAGSSSVVMSLWPIDDKATSTMMAVFYGGLHDGQSVDEALHAAKLSLINSGDPVLANPYYWAGMASMGKTGKVQPAISR